MKLNRPIYWLISLLGLLPFSPTLLIADPSQPAVPAQVLTRAEAEILIYLVPAAHDIRKGPGDVSWDDEGEACNTEVYYCFWVLNATPGVEWPLTVGHFAVNKYTADVWDMILIEQLRAK